MKYQLTGDPIKLCLILSKETDEVSHVHLHYFKFLTQARVCYDVTDTFQKINLCMIFTQPNENTFNITLLRIQNFLQ